jgi:hypothetical protein
MQIAQNSEGSGMSIPDKISGMERQLKVAGVSVHDLCQQADIARSTWSRWKCGKTIPNMATWAAVELAASILIDSASTPEKDRAA